MCYNNPCDSICRKHIKNEHLHSSCSPAPSKNFAIIAIIANYTTNITLHINKIAGFSAQTAILHYQKTAEIAEITEIPP